MAQQSTEYGRRQGHDHEIINFPFAASQALKKLGGNFLKTDGSGNAQLAIATDTEVIGHTLLNEDFTTSSTTAGTNLPVDMSLGSIFEIPINSGTWADTMLGKSCDISVAAGIQGANLLAATQAVLIIVGKGTTNPAGTVLSVLVKRNPAKIIYRTIV